MVVDKPSTLPIHPCGEWGGDLQPLLQWLISWFDNPKPFVPGGYNFNSLFEILAQWKPESYGPGKLFTVHRLDRLTSGLVIIAKSSALARTLSKCIMDRDGCEKIYLAKVKGRFPLGVQHMEAANDLEYQYSPAGSDDDADGGAHQSKRIKCSVSPPCQYGEEIEPMRNVWRGGLSVPLVSNESDKKKLDGCSTSTQSSAGFGYWITDGRGAVMSNVPLQDLVKQCEDVSAEEMLTRTIGSASEDAACSEQSALWLNFACPCRIASHKNGVCEAGDFSDLTAENDRKGIKPAQTSFALLSYDASSDTSLVLAKPVTGRTHQIRLHLQKLGHPIANDHCYGGQLWFGDEAGKEVCKKSRDWLDRLDRREGRLADNDEESVVQSVTPKDSTNADTPATEAEIYHAAADRPREEGESIFDFIEKTCVWCARCRGVDRLDDLKSKDDNDSAVFRRTLMEYFVRSQGIWLHALQYGMTTHDENGRSITVHRTDLPSWAK